MCTCPTFLAIVNTMRPPKVLVSCRHHTERRGVDDLCLVFIDASNWKIHQVSPIDLCGREMAPSHITTSARYSDRKHLTEPRVRGDSRDKKYQQRKLLRLVFGKPDWASRGPIASHLVVVGFCELQVFFLSSSQVLFYLLSIGECG